MTSNRSCRYLKQLYSTNDSTNELISSRRDVIATTVTSTASDDEVELILSCPDQWINYIFYKGYVAVNGASLTVARKESDTFSVFLIPETLKATNLNEILDGDLLNIEVDQTTYAAVKAAEARFADN